jgi:hypothetical protein
MTIDTFTIDESDATRLMFVVRLLVERLNAQLEELHRLADVDELDRDELRDLVHDVTMTGSVLQDELEAARTPT